MIKKNDFGLKSVIKKNDRLKSVIKKNAVLHTGVYGRFSSMKSRVKVVLAVFRSAGLPVGLNAVKHVLIFTFC